MSNNDIWHVICLICILTLPLLFGLDLENSDENLSVTYFLKTSRMYGFNSIHWF